MCKKIHIHKIELLNCGLSMLQINTLSITYISDIYTNW